MAGGGRVVLCCLLADAGGIGFCGFLWPSAVKYMAASRGILTKRTGYCRLTGFSESASAKQLGHLVPGPRSLNEGCLIRPLAGVGMRCAPNQGSSTTWLSYSTPRRGRSWAHVATSMVLRGANRGAAEERRIPQELGTNEGSANPNPVPASDLSTREAKLAPCRTCP